MQFSAEIAKTKLDTNLKRKIKRYLHFHSFGNTNLTVHPQLWVKSMCLTGIFKEMSELLCLNIEIVHKFRHVISERYVTLHRKQSYRCSYIKHTANIKRPSKRKAKFSDVLKNGYLLPSYRRVSAKNKPTTSLKYGIKIAEINTPLPKRREA